MKNYINQIEQLLAQNKTTGNNHSAEMLHYTRMNLARLKRWLSKGVILEEAKKVMQSITNQQHWIIITEAWCGDAAHSIAFIQKIADLTPLVSVTYKLRDENLELIDQYLTNGGRSIPKLIARDKNGNDLFDWGPRPAHIQKKYKEMKAKEIPYAEISIELQKCYNKDKGVSIQQEIITRIKDNGIIQQ